MALFHKFCIIGSCVLSSSQNIPKKKEKRNKSRGWKELWMSPTRAEALKQVLKILFRRTEEHYSCSLPKLLQVFLIRSSWSWKLTLPTPIHMQILRLPDTQSIKEEVSNENPLCRCNTIPVLAGEARTGEGELWGWGGSGEKKGTHRREKGIKKRRVREKDLRPPVLTNGVSTDMSQTHHPILWKQVVTWPRSCALQSDGWLNGLLR